MNTKHKHRPILYGALIFGALLAALALLTIGIFYYAFAIPEPEGFSLASWPNRFTENFSLWIEEEDNQIRIKESGLKQLDEYGLWIQIVDESGHEVFSFHKPDSYPDTYTLTDWLFQSKSQYENGYTTFVSDLSLSNRTLNYVIGFPYDIGKTIVYYNGQNLTRLSPFTKNILLTCFCSLVLALFGYALWLSRKLSTLTSAIQKIAEKNYQPIKEAGVFGRVHHSLNQMNTDLRHGEAIQQQTDQARQEWIANITHDLKTPLSPIKGYGELLGQGGRLDEQTIQEYGNIILKNANHMEKLMNDLKLTYQLQAGALPLALQNIRIVRFLKELVIDILNDPAFSNRTVEFESSLPECIVAADPDLLRRGIGNLVVNALTHTSPKAAVKMIVDQFDEKTLSISICDNGDGMSEAELSRLWDRYYRGTNTQASSEGTGLGLAIARQIIMLHGGEILVTSKIGSGTEFKILLSFQLI